MIKTNDIKKGQRVMLRNGWEADMMDNGRGNTRLAMVFGFEREAGSVYAHDIMRVQVKDDSPNGYTWQRVEHTVAQIKLRARVAAYGF